MKRPAPAAARGLLLLPVFLPAVVLFPLLDRIMGGWWGVLGVAVCVVGLSAWLLAGSRRRRPAGPEGPRHRLRQQL